MPDYPPEYLYKVEYTTEGATDLTVAFEYLLPSHVFVTRRASGVAEEDATILTVGDDWVWLDPYTIQLTDPIASGETIVIQRQTRIDARMVDYANGARLGEYDLNSVTKQLLYLIQEITEARVDIPGSGGSGGGGGDNPPLTEDEIDDLIDDILASETFLQLVELIDLMDISAETIIANQLNNHRDWLITGDFDFRLDEQGTTIEQHEFELTDEDGAVAQVGTLLGSRIDDNEASIGTLQTTQADHDSAIATMQVDIQARVPYNDLENQITLSSYVNGIKTTADGNTAQIEGVESALVGIGGDFENPEEQSALGIMQSEIDGNAGEITAQQLEIAGLQDEVDPEGDGAIGVLFNWRQNLSAYFNANPSDGTSLATAIQNEWQVYADVDSATAQTVQTLEANTQPLFFREQPPDPEDAEFIGTNWSSYGFPEGSMWYKILPGNETEPYIYSDSSAEGSISLSIGYWIPATDAQLEDAMGAKIQEMSDVLIGPDETAADLQTTLQAVWGGNIASVAEAMTAYIQPPSDNPPVEPGIIYSGWNVRANVNTTGGETVVAGVGLGIQQDPFNPDSEAVSDFIAMADRFAVIAPPSVGTILDGVLDSNTVKVPFVIDTQSGEVVINGNLFVRGTLRAYEGGMYDLNVGRLQAGQMDGNVELDDPDGIRVGLYSSTGGFWSSNTASPFPGGSNPQEFLIWGGEGDMNHNNAIFYIDTDGNAFFGGQVSADNISGSLNTLEVLDVTASSPVTANSNFNPVWIPDGQGNTVFSVGGSNTRGRKPYAIINVAMFGSGALEGRARMEMRLETSPGVYGSWQNVSEYPLYQETGSSLTLAGGIDQETSYGAQVRVGVLRENGYSPRSNRFSGIFVMTT